MLDELLLKRTIRKFLDCYEQRYWNELISDIFEIGVLSLQIKYHKSTFTKDEFNIIKIDLQNNEYFRHLNYYLTPEINTGIQSPYITRQLSPNDQERSNYITVNNYNNNKRNKKSSHDKTYTTSNIYPSWWADHSEEDNLKNKSTSKHKTRNNARNGNINNKKCDINDNMKTIEHDLPQKNIIVKSDDHNKKIEKLLKQCKINTEITYDKNFIPKIIRNKINGHIYKGLIFNDIYRNKSDNYHKKMKSHNNRSYSNKQMYKNIKLMKIQSLDSIESPNI